MAVLTECRDCSDVQRGGGRRIVDGHLTTVCPACGSPSYRSQRVDGDLEAERERIIDRVRGAPGVRNGTAENLADYFLTFERLEATGLDELRDVNGMGEQNAQALADRLW